MATSSPACATNTQPLVHITSSASVPYMCVVMREGMWVDARKLEKAAKRNVKRQEWKGNRKYMSLTWWYTSLMPSLWR